MYKIFLLFFFTFSLYASVSTVEQALQKELYNKNEWKALLHYENNFYIKDKKFLLDAAKTPKEELIATINNFYDDVGKYQDINQHPQCKFPARKLFIEHELGQVNIFPKISCPALDEYRDKAPIDEISLIYVSENVKHPTSMMGHSFFKFDGKISQGKVSHAASFYTVINSANPLVLAYQNFYSGMEGKFALRPYREVLMEYMNEDRNVWEYKLNMDKYRRELIYYHIWELKDVELKYYFASYNCATVVYFSLVLAKPELYKQYSFWMSPLQSAKLLYRNNLIENVELSPTNEWLLRMSSQQLKHSQKNKIEKIVLNQESSAIHGLSYFELQFLLAYSISEYEKNEIDKKEFEKLLSDINKTLKKLDTNIDISEYKSPKKIPNERQIRIGYARQENKNYTKFGFLPASHFLSDDNREYFTESDLRIFGFSMIANRDAVYLDEFDVYGMKSYIPFEKYSKNFSYEFQIKVDRTLGREMNYLYKYQVDGGVGVDFQMFHDIHIFTMLNSGIAYDKMNKVYLDSEPYIGLMIYEIGDMKTVVRYSRQFINSKGILDNFDLEHNVFIEKNWKANVSFSHFASLKKDAKSTNEFEFSLNYMF